MGIVWWIWLWNIDHFVGSFESDLINGGYLLLFSIIFKKTESENTDVFSLAEKIVNN